LPRDFDKILDAFREPENCPQLIICARRTALPNAAQIDIPSLELRRAEWPRIASEYIEGAACVFGVTDDLVSPENVAWVLGHLALKEPAISDIEKAALRLVALRVTRTMSDAARLLGMAPVSLARWIGRRS
jgi:hypothetical protein